MDWDGLTNNERLVAEQAVAAYRTAIGAMRAAPDGRGMARVEQAVRDRGFESLRMMVELAASEHDGAQKKGPAAGPVRAARRRATARGPARRS
jgi:hypothetical protein